MGLPVDHHKAGRGVHPRVQSQNPEGRGRGARGHQKGRNGVHPLTHPPTPKQHDAQHGGFQKERREHLVGQQRPGHVAHRVHEAGPVGAKLKTHGDAAHHAQGKGERKNLHPKLVGVHPVRLPRGDKPGFEKQQHPTHGNADGGEQDMKGHVGRKLDASHQDGVKVFHDSPR